MRIIPLILFGLTACAPELAVNHGVSEPALFQNPTQPLAVQVSIQCDSPQCNQLVAVAVTETGQPVSWIWTWGSQVTQGSVAFLPITDGVELLHLETSDASGLVTENEVFVNMMPGEGAGGVPDPAGITFVPRGPCKNIPVISIGGCFTSDTTLQFTANGVETHNVGFSRMAMDPEILGSGYYSDTSLPAFWRFGDPMVEHAAFWIDGEPYHDEPGRHFTFYFDGEVPAFDGDAPLYATVDTYHTVDGDISGNQYQMRIGCGADGMMSSFERRPLPQ